MYKRWYCGLISVCGYIAYDISVRGYVRLKIFLLFTTICFTFWYYLLYYSQLFQLLVLVWLLIWLIFAYMQDLISWFSSSEGAFSGVIFLLGTHHIYHYVASYVANLRSLDGFNYKFIRQSSYRLPRQFHPKGTLLYGHKVLFQRQLWATTRTTHAEVSPIGSLA
jgi:energy-coupling factor transporter transmembrane protein EcfT